MANNMMFREVIQKMAQMNNGAVGDYYDSDNLLICGKCGGRKQARKTILGQVMRVPIMCPCEQQQEEEATARKARADAAARIDRMRERGLTDCRYLRWTFDADDRQNGAVSDIAQRYVKNWEEMQKKNIGILFCGDVGTGKTFFAACIANRLIESGTSVLMTTIPRLMTAMAQDYGAGEQTVLSEIASIPLLILDDLGVERGTEYALERMQQIIDARYRSGKPLIVTTNLTSAELTTPSDMRYKRAYDRILEMCYPVPVTGDSRRRTQARTMRDEARALLGII